MCAYRGELTLFDYKSDDAFDNDVAASEQELDLHVHEPQHVPVNQGDGVNDLIDLIPVSVIDLQLKPRYEPDDQVSVN